MEKIIDYFLIKDVKKKPDDIAKERLLVLSLFFMVILSILMTPGYIYLKIDILLNFIYLLFAGSTFILLLFKTTGNLKVASFLFISFCLMLLFLNIVFTGAISSVLVIWLIILPILAILLDNGWIRYSIISCVLVLTSLVVFEYLGITFPNEIDGNRGVYLNFFSRINFMASIVLIIYLYDEKRKLDKSLLEKSNKDLEQFAYVASHDMKAPLRNMMSFTQILQRRIKDKIEPKDEEYIEHILSNGYQMNELIQGILDISKIEKQETLVLKETDLNIVLTKVKMNLEHTFEVENAILEYEILPTIIANEPQIVQLFQNIIENGIKYNRRKQSQITISHQQDAKQIHLYFRDNGIGINPQYYDKIFEMFKRLHSGFEFKGTGIGLAICKKIALRHKGDLTVEKSSDEGTVFKLSLPVK